MKSLNDMIDGLGLDRRRVADEMGLSYGSLVKRLNGFQPWGLREEFQLQKIIGDAEKKKLKNGGIKMSAAVLNKIARRELERAAMPIVEGNFQSARLVLRDAMHENFVGFDESGEPGVRADGVFYPLATHQAEAVNELRKRYSEFATAESKPHNPKAKPYSEVQAMDPLSQGKFFTEGGEISQ